MNQTGSSGVPDVGNGGPGYDLPDEPPTREYAAGDVAMAQGGGTNSGSQFFFTIDPASLQGGTYPIIGKVSEGDDVVQAINALGGADEAADEVGHDRLGDDHRVLTSAATAARVEVGGLAAAEHGHLGDAVGAPRAVRVAQQRGAPRHADEDQVGRAQLAGAVDRVLGPGVELGDDREVGEQARGPSVKAPPRGSTIGSHRPWRRPTEPASTAPPSQAATIASHTGVSLSTERRCIGDSPTR